MKLKENQQIACSCFGKSLKNFPQFGAYDCEATIACYDFFCRGYQYATNSSLRKYGIDAALQV
jgi:hypothetical protein